MVVQIETLVDTNGDNIISEKELGNHFKANGINRDAATEIASIDEDGNGAVELSELCLDAYLDQSRNERGGRLMSLLQKPVVASATSDLRKYTSYCNVLNDQYWEAVLQVESLVDQDGDFDITAKELGDFFQANGINKDPVVATAETDSNGNGVTELSELCLDAYLDQSRNQGGRLISLLQQPVIARTNISSARNQSAECSQLSNVFWDAVVDVVSQVDTNGDNDISVGELRNFFQANRIPQDPVAEVAAIDSNGNGVVELRELCADALSAQRGNRGQVSLLSMEPVVAHINE